MPLFAPIAIVGQGCVLPDALSPAALWENIAAGKSAITALPTQVWGVSPEYALGTPESCVDRTYSTAGGYVLDFERTFDPAGTHLHESDILALDPLFHWLLDSARQALRESGFAGPCASERCGLILGNLSFPTRTMAAYGETALFADIAPQLPALDVAPDPRNRFMSGLPAQLLARALGLGAGAFCLDAACASSLYAIRIAADWLHNGRADLMLAGAVNAVDSLFIHNGFCALNALSPSGRSRPFHRQADGLVPAEGAGMVALMRLDDAVNHGKIILGVIRGVGLSNDGRSRNLLAPASAGQLRAMQVAYAQAGLQPADIDLIECHATGTPVGDRTELESLRALWANAGERAYIGSLKSNLGHLITAAGVAGLHKVLGALKHEQIPPTLHTDDPLEELADGPFALATRLTPWRVRGDQPRRAALSAFGFGGNNAHLIIEEWRASATWSIPAIPKRTESVAVVGLAARIGSVGSADEIAELLSVGKPPASFIAECVEIDLQGVRFPPLDLKHALAQQLLIFEIIRAAVTDLPATALASERTGVLVGMGCDVAVTTPGIRWRLPERVRAWNQRAGLHLDADAVSVWEAALRGALGEPLGAQDVLGQMPNIPANRLNVQLDLRGPGFSVSAEELSGLAALDTAIAWLRCGELDTAIVGAVDVCNDVRHRAAVAAIAGENAPPTADAAVALVLMRAETAYEAGLPVHALIDDCCLSTAGKPPSDRDDARLRIISSSLHDLSDSAGVRIKELLGHSHAAAGLVGVLAAVLACRERLLPGHTPAPWLENKNVPRRVTVTAGGLGGSSAVVSLTATAPLIERPKNRSLQPCAVALSASSPQALTAQIKQFLAHGQAADRAGGEHRLAAVAPDRETLNARLRQALTDSAVDGVFTGSGPTRVQDEIALVFGAAASPYPSMGRSLLVAVPELAETLGARVDRLRDAFQADWLYGGRNHDPDYLDELLAASCLSQAHAVFSREILGIEAGAAIGYSLGESSALFALGAWTDLGAMLDDIAASALFSSELAGRCTAMRRFLQEHGCAGLADEDRVWASYTLLAPVADVRAAAGAEPLVFITLINTDNETVIGGHPAACERVVKALGCTAVALPTAPAVHGEMLRPAAAAYRSLHRRPTRSVPGVRFYSHAHGGVYRIGMQACADALLGQALTAVDFPALIRRAWDDGVRVFVDHGPRGLCAAWIRSILKDRPHVALALDAYGRCSLSQSLETAARLFAAGVQLDLKRFAPAPALRPAGLLEIPVRRTPVALPLPPTLASRVRQMAPAPELPPVFAPDPVSEEAPLAAATAAPVDNLLWRVLSGQRADVGAAHRGFVERQSDLHRTFLNQRRAVLERFTDMVQTRLPAQRAEPAEGLNPGVLFDRADLERLASGRISEIFGPLFALQDNFVRQVRMPMPPLLLCDRVLRIDAEAGVLAPRQSIFTETDIGWNAWYLHQGRIPSGVLIEAGQADLLLISWMGVDFENRGERVYRLLGCDLTYHRELPRAGATLHYDIHIDGFAAQGHTRLFFFHSDCRLGGPQGELVLSVRNGQAGFFSDRELAESGGVLWSPESDAVDLSRFTLIPPRLAPPRRVYRRDHLEAFASGDLQSCFGAGFERAVCHVRTPVIQGGDMLLLDRVTDLDPAGGPWRRGYLRAELDLHPRCWFFAGHFKDDPCMPGTLMFEGCLQCLSFYLAALGFTLDADGWRFEPLTGRVFQLRCRGQAVPTSRKLVYEVFVKGLSDDPTPQICADILVTVDGLKALHCKEVELGLAVDWPLSSRPELTGEQPKPDGYDAVADPTDLDGNVVFGQYELLAIAWGRPSDALGELYRRFDGTARVPRLPGPPYHFMSRVRSVTGPLGAMRSGACAVIEYDPPPDAWFYAANGAPLMPFAVFLEVVLQPCGWLSSYVGSVLAAGGDVYYRNLDGELRVFGVVTPTVRRLRTEVTLVNVASSGGMIVQTFDIAMSADAAPLCQGRTVFGFFPAHALARQVGLSSRNAATIDVVDEGFPLDLNERPARYCRGVLRLPEPGLLMLDSIAAYWPEGGAAGLGRVLATKRVDSAEWFFRAHFYQDPVQPGSLGLEAMLQAMQWLMIHNNMDDGVAGELIAEPCFALDDELQVWKYRGQVRLECTDVQIEVEVLEIGQQKLVAEAWLWADGLCIYHAPRLGLRICSREPCAIGYDSAP